MSMKRRNIPDKVAEEQCGNLQPCKKKCGALMRFSSAMHLFACVFNELYYGVSMGTSKQVNCWALDQTISLAHWDPSMISGHTMHL